MNVPFGRLLVHPSISAFKKSLYLCVHFLRHVPNLTMAAILPVFVQAGLLVLPKGTPMPRLATPPLMPIRFVDVGIFSDVILYHLISYTLRNIYWQSIFSCIGYGFLVGHRFIFFILTEGRGKVLSFSRASHAKIFFLIFPIAINILIV